MNQVKKTIDWWEKKRLVYNVIIIAIEMMMIILLWDGATKIGITTTILGSIVYTMVANIFYSIGWGLSVTSDYYGVRLSQIIEPFRWLLFIAGTVLSIFLTIVIYKETLLYYFKMTHVESM